MADNGGSGGPYRQRAPSDHRLSHRISSLSEISDFENFSYDEPVSPIRARASLVSLQSYDGPLSPHEFGDVVATPQSTTSSWSGSFSYSSGGYEPVAGAGPAPVRYPSRAGRKASRTSSLRGTHAPIPEEEYGLSLLQSAAPMGKTSPYESIAEHEPEEIFDLTASLGPMGPQDEAFMRKLQEQEASGQLTGGLGTGFKPDTTIRGEDLLLAPATVQRSLTRSFSRRRPGGLGQAATIRGLGQEEANKRGEVIEVIIEEPMLPSEVDLSVVTGLNSLDDEPGTMRRSTLPVKTQRTQMFYPQPNWKPFSMRWPYLTALTLLSIGLAVMQEFLYQRSITEPLLRFHSPSDVQPANYFAIKFLPTIMAVGYGVLWQITDFEVKRLEAFYQLSKEGGALAAESINVDYITSFSFMRPYRAFKLRHYAVGVSSIATSLAVSLVPTFGAASLVLTPDRAERLANPNGEKLILLHPVWSRLLSSTLCVCALSGCILFYLLQTRKSGLLADVKGIAGLASMAVVSHILVDFTDLDVVSHRDIHAKLKHHRYVIRNSSMAPDNENPVSSQDRDRFHDHHLSENPHPLMLRMEGSIPFLVGIVLFLGFIPAFLFTPAMIVTNKAPWAVTALAVCIKLSWGSMETDVRMMEPYYILSRRHAPPKTLALDYTAMPFGYLPFRAFMNGHMLVFVVGFGSIMAEILTVLLTSLATVEGSDFIGMGLGTPDKPINPDLEQINAGQETIVSFWILFGLASFILLYMGIVATIVFIRRRHPFLPRQPNTIASVLAFIHQSKMIYDFVGTTKLSNARMEQKLEEMDKTYGLGWFEGRDGQTHCGVDQEELISNYKHGIDYQQTNKPWNQQWDVL